MTRSAGDMAYTPPRIKDHGSLIDLTADFDVNFVGSVAKVLTIAAASAPMPGGGGDAPDGGVAMNLPPGGEPPGDLPGGTGGEQENGPGGAALTERESGGLPDRGWRPERGHGGCRAGWCGRRDDPGVRGRPAAVHRVRGVVMGGCGSGDDHYRGDAAPHAQTRRLEAPSATGAAGPSDSSFGEPSPRPALQTRTPSAARPRSRG